MKKWIIIAISIIVIIIGGYFIYRAVSGSKETPFTLIPVSRGEIIENVSVTGTVISAKEIDLQFESKGKIQKIEVGVGDQVEANQVLIRLDTGELSAQLQAEAGLEAEKVRLDELKRGARTEEIQIAQTQVLNAENSLNDAQVNFENVGNKTKVDIENIYTSAITSLQGAGNLSKKALLFSSDIQIAHFNELDQESLRVQEAKEAAVFILLGESNTGRWNTKFLSELEGGAFGLIKTIPNGQAFDEIDSALSLMLTALNDVKKALEVIPVSNKLSSSEQIGLNAEKSVIIGQITAISGNQQAISAQKVVNQSLINAAEASLNNTQNMLDSAKAQLELVESGASPEQIALQETRIKSAQATVRQIQAQLSKTIIRSPIRGTLAVLPIRLGELISPGQLIASIVNTSGLEIRAYVDSKELLQINLGNKVIIEDNIEGRVTRVAPSIDPATKKVEINIIVADPQKSNLVVGQFVNLDIFINKNSISDDIYLMPLEAVKITPDKAFVYSVNENKIIEYPITLGKIIGESVEVIDGINPQMKIISAVRGLSIGQKVEIE